MSQPEPGPLASPVCYAAEADDVYMGYLGRDEVVAMLQELLQAERAGVRVGARLSQTAPEPSLLAFARTIRDDEAHWCRVLSGALKRLGVKPSTKVGAFYGKVMALDGFEARLALVDKGQSWVARRLEEALPKIRDDQLHAELKDMLEAHVANIDLGRKAMQHGAPARR